VIGWFMLLMTVTGVYFGLCGAVVAMLSGEPSAAPAAISRSIPLLVMIGLGYLVLVLSLNVVMRLYLQRDLWAKVMASVHLHGIEAAANVGAKGDLASALGEGFADGLDVAGF